MIRIYDILKECERRGLLRVDEEESEHARNRFSGRFRGTEGIKPEELEELERRYAKVDEKSEKYKEAAILLFMLDRELKFYTPNSNHYQIGDNIWVVIRNGKIVTVFVRKSSSNFSYWYSGHKADKDRGNVHRKNIYYMNDNLEIKFLPSNEFDNVQRKLSIIPDFKHDYTKKRDEAPD